MCDGGVPCQTELVVCDGGVPCLTEVVGCVGGGSGHWQNV